MINKDFERYKHKVATALRSQGFKGDPVAFAENLETSFEEHSALDPKGNHWTAMIHEDLFEFMRENPHEFEARH